MVQDAGTRDELHKRDTNRVTEQRVTVKMDGYMKQSQRRLQFDTDELSNDDTAADAASREVREPQYKVRIAVRQRD